MKSITIIIPVLMALALLLTGGCKAPTAHGEADLWLGEANPNPFQIGESTRIEYRAPNSADSYLVIQNCLGQEVYYQEVTGNGSVFWNGRDRHGRLVSEGVYFFKLVLGSESVTRKLIIFK
ncbi:MAG: T9SS type A sorting domain-containing protein [Candidatus Cloacimonadaceae bacterium]|nr:T9SS type A sorting domain-containing protein [Candidatus Cloacimonadaceae bacterium]